MTPDDLLTFKMVPFEPQKILDKTLFKIRYFRRIRAKKAISAVIMLLIVYESWNSYTLGLYNVMLNLSNWNLSDLFNIYQFSG